MVIVKKYGAEWCSHCKFLSKELEETPLIRELESIDVDELEDEDIDKLNIMTIPVCIIYKDDKEVKRFVNEYTPKDINNYITENNL